MVATVIQRRRGSNTDHGTFAGALAELTVDTTQNRLVVHDGATPGGHPVAKKTEVDGKASRSLDNLTGDFLNNLNVYTRDQVDSLLVSPVAGRTNRIVNGDMFMSQAAAGAAVNTSGAYPVDEWIVAHTSDGAWSAQQYLSSTPAGSIRRLRLAIVTADLSLAAGQSLFVYQKLEGIRLADALFGTASARQLVFRFGFKGPAGTYCVFFRNGATNRSFIREFTIGAGEADTDVVREVTIPGDTTGTWPIGTTYGYSIGFCLATGSTLQAAKDTWHAGNYIGTAAQSNGLASSANVFEIFDVGLKIDPESIGYYGLYEPPLIKDTMDDCFRYYQKTTTAIPVGTSAAPTVFSLAKVMRITPTITGGGAGFTSGGFAGHVAGWFYQTTGGGQTLTFDARM